MFIEFKRHDNNHKITFNIDQIRFFEEVVDGANEDQHGMINGEIEVVETHDQIRDAIRSARA